jgi:hypothetical protein
VSDAPRAALAASDENVLAGLLRQTGYCNRCALVARLLLEQGVTLAPPRAPNDTHHAHKLLVPADRECSPCAPDCPACAAEDAAAPPRAPSEPEIEATSGFTCPKCGRQSLHRNIKALCRNPDCDYAELAPPAPPSEMGSVLTTEQYLEVLREIEGRAVHYRSARSISGRPVRGRAMDGSPRYIR